MAGNLRMERDRGDYFALVKQRRREMENPLIRRLSWIVGAIAFLITLGLIAASHLELTVAAAIMAVAAFFGIWWMIWWAGWPLLEEKVYPVPENFSDPIDLFLREGGIEAVNRWGRALYPWQAISDIAQTKTHYFVRRGKSTVIVMPRRLFDASPDASQFLSELRSQIGAN